MATLSLEGVLPLKAPTLALDVPNWPMADGRGLAQFRVLRDAMGLEFAIRQVEGGTPQASPSASRVRIVQGTDSKTYFVGYRKTTDFLACSKRDNDIAFIMSARRNAKPVWFDQGELFQAIKTILEC